MIDAPTFAKASQSSPIWASINVCSVKCEKVEKPPEKPIAGTQPLRVVAY